MARIKIKNDTLAKLRQFKKGMDIEDFLEGQFRQVVRALESNYVDVTDNFNIYGFYGYKTTSVTTTQTLVFEEFLVNPDFGGIFSNTTFKNKKSGKYWIDASWYSASTGAGPSLKVELKNIAGTVLATRTVLGTQNIQFFTTLPENDGLYFDLTITNVTVDNFSLKITKISD